MQGTYIAHCTTASTTTTILAPLLSAINHSRHGLQCSATTTRLAKVSVVVLVVLPPQPLVLLAAPPCSCGTSTLSLTSVAPHLFQPHRCWCHSTV